MTGVSPNASLMQGHHCEGVVGLSLWFLLGIAILRLWVMPLPSSFWVDEMVTVFVAEHPNDASFAPVPQVPASIYYAIPRAAASLFGRSEIVYRLPSLLFMGVALWLIARIASRLIHPDAGWFAVFLCLSLRWINYFAVDARPYAMGIAVSAAAIWFLIRWLDTAAGLDALLFVAFAALLWRVHLVYWPFYLVFALYILLRISGRDTRVTWRTTAPVIALLVLLLVPLLGETARILRNAGDHVIVALPGIREFQHLVRWSVVVLAGGGAWLAARLLRWPAPVTKISSTALALVFAWWLGQPLCLYLYSHITGNSVFVDRYLSLQLPGIALSATAVAARWIPTAHWRQASLVVGAVALALMGNWTTLRPRHDNSDWRAAALAVNSAAIDAQTPILCASPFIEARVPVWRPDYPLPGFLYAHLSVYPVKGKLFLFPFDRHDAETYAASLMDSSLTAQRSFVIYGGQGNVDDLRKWFASRAERRNWSISNALFGDVGVTVFNRVTE